MRALLFTALVAVSSSAPMAQEIVESNDYFVSRLTRAEVMAETSRAAAAGEMQTQGEITMVAASSSDAGRSRSDVRTEGRLAAQTHATGTVYDVSYEN